MNARRIPINGIDLDGTLLPYDSMRRYWLWQLRKARTAPFAAVLAVLRLSGTIGRAQFTEKLVRAARRMKTYEDEMCQFASRISREIRSPSSA